MLVEITARLGDTVIDHALRPAGDIYDLAGHRCVVKPSVHGMGLVTITMTRTTAIAARVPIRPFAWRPIVYAAASLLVHLAILLVAFVHEPFEKMTAPIEARPRLLVHVDEEPKPMPAAARIAPASTMGDRPAAKRHRRRRAERGDTPDQAIASLASTMKNIGRNGLADVGPVYDEDVANRNAFGNHLWDIDNDPDFATVKTPEGYDLSELAGYAELYELKGEAKTKRKFEMQTALAHKSAARGDCFPAHRIAKWLEKLDGKLFASMYLADPAIRDCLRQEVDPRVQWHGVIPTER